MMQIHRVKAGPLACNAYVLWEKGRQDAVVIDPGGSEDLIFQALDGREIAAILLTHGHCDHIGACDALRGEGTAVYIHGSDGAMLADPGLNLSEMVGRAFSQKPANHLVQDGARIQAAGLEFTVLHTPGHTPGSACFRCGDVLFSGDTLFKAGYGRFDLPGGSEKSLKRSLSRLFALKGIGRVLPGHEQETTLDAERGRYA